jgi:hypothetical protein
MKKILIITGFLLNIAIFIYPLSTVEEFQKITQWNHGDKGFFKGIDDPLIDDFGHLVLPIGGKIGTFIISQKDALLFAPFGQGPSDISLLMATCHFQNDIAFLEYPQKIKIFTSKENTYVWKETKWLKQEYYSILAKDMLYINDQWVLGGYFLLKEDTHKEFAEMVKVYNNKGKPIKALIKREFPSPNRNRDMDSYLTTYDGRIFFMLENELKVYEISAAQMKVKKEIALTVPTFYKKMPADFYKFKRYTDDKEYHLDYEKWKTAYSRITRVTVEDGYLVLQIRTPGKDQKKFAMLFYTLDNFELKHTLPIDDYFLGARNGVYYFYKNGNPGYDEGTDECIIQLYSFREKK